MSNIACLLFINLAFNASHTSPVGSARAESLDTVPVEKIILYTEDLSVHHTRQQMFLGNLSKIMGLPSLHEKTDELFIRIWLWDFGEHYVIDISKNGSQYTCSALSWNSKKIDSNDYVIIHKEWPILIPKSGWNLFFKTLNKYQILKLKSGLSFEQHTGHLTQSSYVQFELEERGSYRYYEYLEPSYYRFVEKGSNKVYSFLKYFDQQMNIDAYMPPENLFERKK
jgi:hypothetical protein